MRFVVININPSRMVKMRRVVPDAEVFEGTGGCGEKNYRTDCIPKTYKRLAAAAVKQKWGRETVVMQDDVWLPQGDGFEEWQLSFDVPLLVFGRTEPSGVVVPKAFSASPEMWVKLKKVWDGKGRIGPAWQPLVQSDGLVLDVTREMGGHVTTRTPCIGCRH